MSRDVTLQALKASAEVQVKSLGHRPGPFLPDGFDPDRHVSACRGCQATVEVDLSPDRGRPSIDGGAVRRPCQKQDRRPDTPAKIRRGEG